MRAVAWLFCACRSCICAIKYLALSDNTLSDDMRTYRQELRDLPDGKDTVEKCENATWPTKP